MSDDLNAMAVIDTVAEAKGFRAAVASGYDAGIHLGEVIDRDMIAVPESCDLRLIVVGTPSNFTRHPK